MAAQRKHYDSTLRRRAIAAFEGIAIAACAMLLVACGGERQHSA